MRVGIVEGGDTGATATMLRRGFRLGRDGQGVSTGLVVRKSEGGRTGDLSPSATSSSELGQDRNYAVDAMVVSAAGQSPFSIWGATDLPSSPRPWFSISNLRGVMALRGTGIRAFEQFVYTTQRLPGMVTLPETGWPGFGPWAAAFPCESFAVIAGIPLRRIPWTIVLCVLALVALGLSGIRRADLFNDGPDLFSKQVTWTLMALPALIAALCIPYRHWKPISYLMFGVSLPLLIVVLFMARRGGARCWIPLGFFDLQPSEIVKLTFILALAQYLMYRENHRRLTGLVAPFLITAAPLLLILIEPDLGSAMLFVPVLFAMLFAAGARARHLICVVLLGMTLCPIFWTRMSAEQKSRVVALFTQVDGGPNPNGDRWHQHQSKLVIALGGTWGSETSGKLLDDDAYRLFAAQTDFVFCMVAERWGLAGGILTLSIYLILYARGLMVAAATREPFGRLLAVGIVALLATQTVINTGMTVGLLPVVGITLPLMSYGGSSLLMTAIAVGLLINVAIRPGYEMTPDPFRFES